MKSINLPPVRIIVLNPEDAAPEYGIYYIMDMRLRDYVLVGDGTVRGKFWLERKGARDE